MELYVHGLQSSSLNVLYAHAYQQLQVSLFHIRLGDVEVVLLVLLTLSLTEDNSSRKVDLYLLDPLGYSVSGNVLYKAVRGRRKDDF